MTMGTLLTAAKTALNAEDFAEDFAATINASPRIERSKLGTGWHCWIVPVSLVRGTRNRRKSRRDVSFDVGLVKQLRSNNENDLTGCLDLADSVQCFVDESMTLLDGCDLTGCDFDPLFSEDHLKQQAVFFSVLSITYQRGVR